MALRECGDNHKTYSSAQCSDIIRNDRMLDLEPLELRRLKTDLVLYYKIFHDLVHLPRDYLPDEPQAPLIDTRSGVARLITPDFSTDQLDNNFFSRCVACWNFLPESVVASQSISAFKRNLVSVDLCSFLHGDVLNS